MTKKVYRVRNWSKYNKGLLSRGSLSVWFNKNYIKSAEGEHGNQAYSDLLILCALTIRQLFNLITTLDDLKRDTITRKDTTLEKLAKLKPAFDKSDKGSLTAGNSTPLTDGASLVLLGSPEWAKAHDLEVLAYFIDCEVAAVDFVHGAGLLMAPTIAVSRLFSQK